MLYRRVEQLEARKAHNLEVTGSSPVPATLTFKKGKYRMTLKKENLDYSKYTYLHRKALGYYIKKNAFLTDEDRLALLNRAKVHDMDKLTLYQIWDKKKASDYHRTHASHHVSELRKLGINPDRLDYLECIFDMECAALTKPDKPLNAYDTLIVHYKDEYENFKPYLEYLHMDSSYVAVNESDLEFFKNLKVSDELILEDINKYLENEDNVLKTLNLTIF